LSIAEDTPQDIIQTLLDRTVLNASTFRVRRFVVFLDTIINLTRKHFCYVLCPSARKMLNLLATGNTGLENPTEGIKANLPSYLRFENSFKVFVQRVLRHVSSA
jgi:hypothetical protein